MEDILFPTFAFVMIGLVVGALGRMIAPTRRTGGWAASLVLGTLGAVSGACVAGRLGMFHGGAQGGLLLSLFGAVILVALYQATTVRRIHA